MSDKSNGHSSKSFNLNVGAKSFVPNPQANEFVPPAPTRANADVNARCGEVVEILEDVIGYSGNNEDDFDGQLNDDELLEMLEMQEECRKELLQSYVQANAPGMFEKIYHDVAYPDAEPVPMPHPQQQQQQQQFVEGINNLSINDNNSTKQQQQSAIDLVKTNLNPDANEFVPKKYMDSKQ